MSLKNKIIISLIGFLLILIINTKVDAASASLSASSTSVYVGTKVTITTTIKGASWQVSLSGAVSATYSDSTSDAEDTKKTEKTTFTPTKAGVYKVNLSGNVTGSNDSKATKVSDSVTITVKEKSSGNNTPTPTASSDATLRNLGINPHDFSGFRKATTSYSVSVPNDTEKISIYAYATDPKATVLGTGSKTLKVGKNTFNIKVTAADKKTTKTYTLNITRKEKQDETQPDNTTSSDATLKNLGIRPKEYDFTGFKPGTLEYSVEVPNETSTINVYATATDSKAEISGVGEKTLKVGTNIFSVKVTSSDKKETKTYKLTITRKEKEEEPEEKTDEKEEDNKLKEGIKNITVSGFTLSPEFDQEVYEYTLEVKDKKEKLDITTETTSDNIEVEIAGNENLKSGENIITILAHNKRDDTTTTYQIVAKLGEQAIDLTEVNKNIDEAQANLEKQAWIIKGTIAAIIILIIIFLVQRYKLQKEMNEEEYFEDEEQDYTTIQKNDNTSEVKNFYKEMEEKNDYYTPDTPEEINETERKGKYRGKRFK